MTRSWFIFLYSLVALSIILFLYFGLNPLKSNTLYLFLQLTAMIIVQGYRRRYLGLRFIGKYNMLAKEFYVEFRRMFTE